MSQCAPFGAEGPAGVADALSKVDCLANDATAVSFGRLFGAHGSFTTALTIILTLYIALLAFNLLTGRSALRISVLTPRMMTLGLVLTFATSWIAYQSVVWNLATGAPDEIASVLVGTNGSATTLFAQQLDGFFTAITDAATSVQPNADAANPAAAAIAASSMTSPTNILSIAALILLLGTVGVLVVCRLALAALLILGPVFIVLALFEGTRGLFEGWLKSVAMFAFVPLLTVVMGSGALVAIAPMVAGLAEAGGGPIPMRTAVSILVAAIIYALAHVAGVQGCGEPDPRLAAGPRSGWSRCRPLPAASWDRIKNVLWRQHRPSPRRRQRLRRTVFETRSRASRRRRPAIASRLALLCRRPHFRLRRPAGNRRTAGCTEPASLPSPPGRRCSQQQ